MRFLANKQRTRELENWKKKNCPSKLCDRAVNHRKSLAVAALLFGSVGTELNWTELSNLWFSAFPVEDSFTSLCFRKICLTKGRLNYRGVSLLCIVHRKSNQQQQIAVTGWFGSHWTVECSITCFLTSSHGTIYVCFCSWFCRICFDWAMARLLCNSFLWVLTGPPGTWTRREFCIC